MNEYNYTIRHGAMSINRAWQGRRFKTVEYKKWRDAISTKIRLEYKPITRAEVKSVEYEIFIDVFIHNYKMADVDNFVKPILDTLTDNSIIVDDRYVKAIHCLKHKLDKGYAEYFNVRILENNIGEENV